MKSFKSILMAGMLLVSTQAFAQFTTGGSARSSSNWADTEYAPKTGYKGFVDFGYGVGVGDIEAGRLQLTTTHGYQICPYVFAGVGLGVSYYTDDEMYNVPIFANGRATLPLSNSRLAPFFDYKIGYSVGDVQGFYMSPSVGLRIGFGENCGFNISVGYEMQKYEYEYYGFEGSENCGAVNFKIGLDF